MLYSQTERSTMIEILTQYFPIVCSIVIGLLLGGWLVVIGFKLGFKVSYEIRECKENGPDGQGLLPNKDDKDFDDIITQMKKADEDDEDEDE